MSLYDGLDIGKEDGGSTKPVGKKEYWKLCVGTVLNEWIKEEERYFISISYSKLELLLNNLTSYIFSKWHLQIQHTLIYYHFTNCFILSWVVF